MLSSVHTGTGHRMKLLALFLGLLVQLGRCLDLTWTYPTEDLHINNLDQVTWSWETPVTYGFQTLWCYAPDDDYYANLKNITLDPDGQFTFNFSLQDAAFSGGCHLNIYRSGNDWGSEENATNSANVYLTFDPNAQPKFWSPTTPNGVTKGGALSSISSALPATTPAISAAAPTQQGTNVTTETGQSEGNDDEDLNTGSIVGIGVGAAIGALIALGIAILVLLRRRKKKRQGTMDSGGPFTGGKAELDSASPRSNDTKYKPLQAWEGSGKIELYGSTPPWQGGDTASEMEGSAVPRHELNWTGTFRMKPRAPSELEGTTPPPEMRSLSSVSQATSPAPEARKTPYGGP